MELDTSDLVMLHYFASRKTFDVRPLYLSFSCDATRIGKRACMLGAVALTSNKFAWCPPQALGIGCAQVLFAGSGVQELRGRRSIMGAGGGLFPM